MFILTRLSDLIQISPQDFEKPSKQAIIDSINTKYANKVIQKIGLCICFYDMSKCGEGLIGHGTGIVNVNVEFRLVVFRPFKGEVIQGRIAYSNPQGIGISLDFFDDIFVPGPGNLFSGCSFNHTEGVWVWYTDGNELFLDNGESVLFRVEVEEWHDLSPQKPQLQQSEEDSAVERKSPYNLIASMTDSGFGPLLWWRGEEEPAS